MISSVSAQDSASQTQDVLQISTARQASPQAKPQPAQTDTVQLSQGALAASRLASGTQTQATKESPTSKS
jgi:hypothetical protein